jgi:DNA repair exonuclease SbcCD nuclease subunit
MKNESILKIAAIADIHFGHIDPEFQYQNLQDHFFTYIKKEKPDIIIIAGDILHERVNMNTITAHVFQRFIDDLIATGCHICITEGTKSHDDHQVNIFSHRINDKFRIYSKVTIDKILGYDFLFIPEEYMSDPTDYYKLFFEKNKKYDFIFGHGTYDEIGFAKKTKQSIIKKLTAPMWSYKQLDSVTNYFIGFGHYHNFFEYKKFNYISSFGRYCHGEEEKKGFMIYEGNKTQGFKRRFIENTGAKRFITIKESELPDSRDELMETLTNLLNKVDSLRIDLNRNTDLERRSDIISFVKKHLNTSIVNTYEKNKKKEDSKNQSDFFMEIVDNKYEHLPFAEATIEFILEKHGVKYEKEKIMEFLKEQ